MAQGGERNERSVWYALYQGITDLRDEQGRRTGAKAITYSNPVQLYANISGAAGSAESSPFGTNVQYNRTMLVFDTESPIDENSILWVEKTPSLKVDGSTDTPHDYVVADKAVGLLSTVFALNRVEAR